MPSSGRSEAEARQDRESALQRLRVARFARLAPAELPAGLGSDRRARGGPVRRRVCVAGNAAASACCHLYSSPALNSRRSSAKRRLADNLSPRCATVGGRAVLHQRVLSTLSGMRPCARRWRCSYAPAACRRATAAVAAPSLTWSAPAEVDGGHKPTGISCPSATLCVAVDDAGRAVVGTRASTGGTWSWSRVRDRRRAGAELGLVPVDRAVRRRRRRRASARRRNPAVGRGVVVAGRDRRHDTAHVDLVRVEHVLRRGRRTGSRALQHDAGRLVSPGAWSAPVAIASSLSSRSPAPRARSASRSTVKVSAVLSTEPTGGASGLAPAADRPRRSTLDRDLVLRGRTRAWRPTRPATCSRAPTPPRRSAQRRAGVGSDVERDRARRVRQARARCRARRSACADGRRHGLRVRERQPDRGAAGMDRERHRLRRRRWRESRAPPKDSAPRSTRTGVVFTATDAPPQSRAPRPASEVAHTSALLLGTVNPNDAALSTAASNTARAPPTKRACRARARRAAASPRPVSATVGGPGGEHDLPLPARREHRDRHERRRRPDVQDLGCRTSSNRTPRSAAHPPRASA